MPLYPFSSGAITALPVPGSLWPVTGTGFGLALPIAGASNTPIGVGGNGPLAVNIAVEGFDPQLTPADVLSAAGAFGLTLPIVGSTAILSAPAPPPPPSISTVPKNARAVLPIWRCPNAFDWCLIARVCGPWTWFARQPRALSTFPPDVTLTIDASEDADVYTPFTGRQVCKRGSIVRPTAAQGNVAVVEWVTPIGVLTAIWALQCQFTGAGWVEGSGDLAFRLRVNSHWSKSYGNILTSLGDGAKPTYLEHPILIPPHSRVRMMAQVSVDGDGNLDPAGRVNVTMEGITWPVGERLDSIPMSEVVK